MDGSTSLRRIAALSVAITLITAPIATAQSPEAAPSTAAPTDTALLSRAAFARLVHQPPGDATPAPVVADPPRINLLRRGSAAMARQAQAAPTKAPQQKSWASRHKVALGVLIGVGAFLGIYLSSCRSYSDEIVCAGFGAP
jgi:hypothetical protein